MNHRLTARARLSPQEKLELVQGMATASNVAEYARERGIDRSYLYQLRDELQGFALQGWEDTTPGRPPHQQPVSEVEQLRAENVRLDEAAKVWEARAVVANWILDALNNADAVIKTSSETPIFWRR